MTRPASLNDVLSACGSLLGAERMNAALGTDRTYPVVRVRQAMCWALRHCPHREPSLSEITQAIGRTSHSTVLTCVDRFSTLDVRERWRSLVRSEVDGVALSRSQIQSVIEEIEKGHP